MRLGHVRLRVLALDAALDHYLNMIGLLEAHRDADGTAYLRGWDEWDKYSMILLESDRAGIDHLAFKVESDSDLDTFAARIDDYGIAVDSIAAGILPFCGRAIRFALPSGHECYLYAEKDFVGKAVGALNPEPWPDGLKGAGAHWLDHVMLTCEFDPATGKNTVADNVAFFRHVLDFGLSEQVVTDGGVQLAAWMFRTTTPHDIAFGVGPTSGLHHVSFFLDEWSDVLKTADILAKRRVKVDVTPQRHGITRGSTTYFFDPSGNRNETFAGLGYLTQPDMPVITWNEDNLWRGIFYHTGNVIGDFLGRLHMIEALAERLRGAYANGAVAPLRDGLAPTDAAAAYAVQGCNTDYWTGVGRRIVGRKVGLTAKAVQLQLGVDQPDFGVLFADMEVADGGMLLASKVLQPKAEAEVAIILHADLPDLDTNADMVAAATGAVTAAIEIIDSRIADWKISFADTVADNGSSAFYVLGADRKPLAGLDLRTCGMALEVNAEVVSLGAGVACLGHPLNAAAWLARTLAARGEPLRAGDVVLTGALGPMVTIKPGDHVKATIGGLGSCSFVYCDDRS